MQRLVLAIAGALSMVVVPTAEGAPVVSTRSVARQTQPLQARAKSRSGEDSIRKFADDYLVGADVDAFVNFVERFTASSGLAANNEDGGRGILFLLLILFALGIIP